MSSLPAMDPARSLKQINDGVKQLFQGQKRLQAASSTLNLAMPKLNKPSNPSNAGAALAGLTTKEKIKNLKS